MSSERKGWVYVVSNPSMPGLVKIGRTDSVVEVRMKDLDTTGVAAPFKKEYEALVKNSNKLEKSVHEKLKNFRYRTNREFFECSPETASKFIKDVATELKIEILHDECFFEVIFDLNPVIEEIDIERLNLKLKTCLQEKKTESLTNFLECDDWLKECICKAINNPPIFLTNKERAERGITEPINYFCKDGKPFTGFQLKIDYSIEELCSPSKKIELYSILNGKRSNYLCDWNEIGEASDFWGQGEGYAWELSLRSRDKKGYYYPKRIGSRHRGFLFESFYENGKLKERVLLDKGKRNGVCSFYYENGQLKEESSYRNGLLNGVVKLWDKYGNLKSEKSYVDCKREGIVKRYYKSGVLKQEIPVIEGLMEGILKEYDESGSLEEETPYVRGIPSGIQKKYYESGPLKEEIKIDGSYAKSKRLRSYYESGVLRWERTENNVEKYYYENGVLERERPINGIAKWYYESGALRSECESVDGKNADGFGYSYYESGSLKSEYKRLNGELDGIQKEYYESGQLKNKQLYKMGKKIRTINKWNEDGSIEE